MMKLLTVIVLVFTLAGCASAPIRERDVAGQAGMTAQRPAYTHASYAPVGEDDFAWPVRGDVIASYGDKVNMVISKGIDIRAQNGAPVRASRSGRVVFSDPYLKGFGNTLILDHGNGYETVYSYNSSVLVKVGDRVRQNDTIAYAGKTGRAKESSLHFEIRRDGKPQDPRKYLR